ncbi:MAG: glycosyltransferase family 4 protein [bacterium]|nr:glycosyltransferase family 4 protein [bacterium]
MRIGIDGNEANVFDRVGSGMYAYQVLKHLYELDSWNEYTIYLKHTPIRDMPEERKNWKYKVIGPEKLWTQFALPLRLFIDGKKLDLFFSPGHYAPRFCPCKTVISVLDTAYLRFPEYFKKSDLIQLKSWSKYSIKKASHILTISESSKQDIVKYYGIEPHKVTVTYLGYDTETFKPVEDQEKIRTVLDKYGFKQPYILYLGTLQPRKNIVRLIQAFKDLISQDNYSHIGLKLVIVGKKGWLYQEIFSEVKKLQLEDVVVFTGYITDDEKPAILSGAVLYTLPSLYEGFGIPVLEAMACGTPVVVSRISSLPEVVGEYGVLIDPYNIKSISDGLKLLVNDTTLREQMKQSGLKWVKQFDWMHTARTTLGVLESFRKND